MCLCIPNNRNFLQMWGEVGRLTDRWPIRCRTRGAGSHFAATKATQATNWTRVAAEIYKRLWSNDLCQKKLFGQVTAFRCRHLQNAP
jgi:hypothetical protein